MEYTQHFSLKKPGLEDPIKISDLNNNADSIDEQLYLEKSTRSEETESLKTRLDNIVAQTGDDITEIVDARVGADSHIYSTLKDRLDTEHTSLKSQIEQLTDNQEIAFSDPSLKQYINTSGNTVSWDSPSVASSDLIKWAVVECQPGDEFTISGSGAGSNARWWAFADANKNLLDPRALTGQNGTNILLTAPENAAYLIINDRNNKKSYRGNLIANRIESIHHMMNEVKAYDVPSFNKATYIIWGSASQPWTYAADASYATTPSGILYSAHKGDEIVLTDYNNVSFSVYTVNASLKYARYINNQEKFTFSEDCSFALSVNYRPSTALNDTNYQALINRIFIVHKSGLIDDYYNKLYDHISDVTAHTNPGFITASGTVTPQTILKEVYTDKIEVQTGYAFTISISYNESHELWAAYATWDENGDFIERTIFWNNITATSKNADITVPANVKYIVFMWRTFNDVSSFSLKSIDNVKILEKRLDADVTLDRANDMVMHYMKNENVISINHRGYNYIAPENTLPAFKLSKANGFRVVETDVRFTSDDVAVCLHDEAINRTARNADGTELSETVNIGDITYANALTYDFGIWKGAQYAGTRIPTFTDFLNLCKKIGLNAYIEIKEYAGSKIQSVIDLVKASGMINHVSWICGNATALNYVKTQLPKARLGLVVSSITAEKINQALGLKTDSNEVFIDTYSYTDSEINLCIADDLPCEVYTINSASTLANINPYVTGVTSDVIVAGYELYMASYR